MWRLTLGELFRRRSDCMLGIQYEMKRNESWIFYTSRRRVSTSPSLRSLTNSSRTPFCLLRVSTIDEQPLCSVGVYLWQCSGGRRKRTTCLFFYLYIRLKLVDQCSMHCLRARVKITSQLEMGCYLMARMGVPWRHYVQPVHLNYFTCQIILFTCICWFNKEIKALIYKHFIIETLEFFVLKDNDMYSNDFGIYIYCLYAR